LSWFGGFPVLEIMFFPTPMIFCWIISRFFYGLWSSEGLCWGFYFDFVPYYLCDERGKKERCLASDNLLFCLFLFWEQLQQEKNYDFASDGTQAVWQRGLFRSRCE